MTWQFINGKGLLLKENPDISLLFNQPRGVIRHKLHFTEAKNKGRADSEDDYQNLFDSAKNWVRLGFENEELFEIEVLEGSVEFNGVTIKIQANLSDTLKALEQVGFQFSLGAYSYTDFDSRLDIGDSDLNGGLPNQVRWLYIAKDFNHFLG